MASKSSNNVYLDNDAGISIQFQSDSSGFEQLIMADANKGQTITMKLDQTNSDILVKALTWANALRKQIPQS